MQSTLCADVDRRSEISEGYQREERASFIKIRVLLECAKKMHPEEDKVL